MFHHRQVEEAKRWGMLRETDDGESDLSAAYLPKPSDTKTKIVSI